MALVAAIALAGGHVTRATFEPAHDAIARMQLVDMDGERWTADRLRGRVTLLDFWATWCAPCLADLPYVKQAIARYGDDGFAVLGISLDVSDRRTFISWTNRHGVTWPQVFDGRGRQGPVPRHFRVSAVPTSFLVGPDARIVGMNLRGDRLIAAVGTQVARLGP
jgi:thiol-disulfide isomerase/thioredoxin